MLTKRWGLTMNAKDLTEWFVSFAPSAFDRWCREQGIAPDTNDAALVRLWIREWFLQPEPPDLAGEVFEAAPANGAPVEPLLNLPKTSSPLRP